MLNEIKVRYFLELAKTLSFTKAANNLFITQQTLSKQISNMEEDLGFQLFERTTKSVRLTKSGKDLYHFFADATAEFDRLVHFGRVSHLNLGVGFLVGMSIVAIKEKVLIPAGNNLTPYSTFLHALPSMEEMWDALSTEQIDIGFFPEGVLGTVSEKDHPKPEIVEIYRGKMYFFVSKLVAEAKHNSNQLEDYRDQCFYVPPAGVPGFFTIQKILTDCGLEDVVLGHPPTQNSALEATANGCGISFADEFSVLGKNTDIVSFPLPYESSLYHDVLTAFKNNYNCSSPLFLADSGVPVGDYLVAGYGVAGFSNPNTTQVPFYQVDGRVEFGPIQDGYYEYLQMIKQWYDEGLIDKDFATTGNFMFPADDLIANDQVGIFYSFVARISAFSDINEDPSFNIQPIADAVKNVGDQNHLRHINSLTAGSIGISSQCAYPEVAAQYMDAWFTNEGYMLANYGTENETYIQDEDGTIQFTDVILNNPDGLSFDMCLYKYCLYNQGVFLNNWERQILSYTDAQKASIEIWNTSDYEYGFSSDITMTAEETEEFTAAYSDIKTYVAENTLNFILGATPLDDAHWNAYVAAVENMGIDHCIEIKQQSVTRYMNRS